MATLNSKAMAFVLVAVTAAAGHATAATKTFQIPVGSVELTGGSHNDAILNMPGGAGNPSFTVSFVMPSDYTKNTPVVVRLLSQSVSPDTCVGHFVAQRSERIRAGLLPFNEGPNEGVGAVVANGGEIGYPGLQGTSTPIVPISIVVRRIPSSPFRNLLPGDMVRFVLKRQGTGPFPENCNDSILIYGIEVRYTIS